MMDPTAFVSSIILGGSALMGLVVLIWARSGSDRS